jgi:broad specificity phosphatase PhoE
VRLFVFARHGNTTWNAERRINGNPAVPVPLSDEGRAQAEVLGLMIAHVHPQLLVHTRFARTVETAKLALGERFDLIPKLELAALDDVDVGNLDGLLIDEYHVWKDAHTRHDRFPGGESLDEAARRYAAAFRALVERPEERVLVVCHDVPLRYLLNGADRSDDLDWPHNKIPNATPFLFSEGALVCAAEQIDRIVYARLVAGA